ncbi:MAG: DMT family transporter [Burkholderiales bacterium]|nr:DMT family transporter [Burkholderiales bacterium]
MPSLTGNQRGALWMLLFALMIVLVSVCVREIGARIGTWQVTLARFVFGLGAILPMLLANGSASWRTRRLGGHAGRTLLMVLGMWCGFHAFSHLPMADAGGLYYSRPVFVLVAAALFLGERLSGARLAAVAVSFAGMLLILKPGGHGFDPLLVVPLAGAILLALGVVHTKSLLATESQAAILFYANVLGALACLPGTVLQWVAPTPWEWLLLVGVGLFGVCSQWAMVRAYAAGAPGAVAPFEYAQFVFAPVAGVLLFHDALDAATLTGMAVIVIAGVRLAQHEQRSSR